jgi:SRSO17 transposase
VPDELRFATKPQIALEQIRTAQMDGIPPGIVLANGPSWPGAARPPC